MNDGLCSFVCFMFKPLNFIVFDTLRFITFWKIDRNEWNFLESLNVPQISNFENPFSISTPFSGSEKAIIFYEAGHIEDSMLKHICKFKPILVNDWKCRSIFVDSAMDAPAVSKMILEIFFLIFLTHINFVGEMSSP